MLTALLTNSAWLDEDLPTFRQLVVGMLDEQVRVVQVVPEVLPLEDTSSFGELLIWKESGWEWLNRRRLLAMEEELDRLNVELIHAMDGRLWNAGMELAMRLDVPLVLNVASAADVERLPRLLRHEGPRVAICATTEPLARAVRDKVTTNIGVEYIPPGVHMDRNAEPPGDDSPMIQCGVIAATGLVDPWTDALLEAIRRIAADHPNVQFFVDSRGADQHGLWQAARERGVLSNVSMVPRRLGHYELLLNADLLIQPQPMGRSRGLHLAAISHGVPVLAAADRWVDYLVDRQSAVIIPEARPEHWEEAIRWAIDEPTQAKELALRARLWIADRCQPAKQVARIITLYRQLVAEAIPFPGEQA